MQKTALTDTLKHTQAVFSATIATSRATHSDAAGQRLSIAVASRVGQACTASNTRHLAAISTQLLLHFRSRRRIKVGPAQPPAGVM